MTVEEIIENFELLDDWEERYRYIIDLGKRLPPLPEELKVDAALVPGCISRVWLHSSLEGEGEGEVRRVLRFQADSDAIIVKGLVAIVLSIYDGKTPEEVVATDVSGLFDQLDLGNQLSANRRNGFVSMLNRIQAEAKALL